YAVQHNSFDGISGKISFDEFGDTTNKQLTVYQVVNGAWKSVKSGVANPK
ncbi:branched-chain amino acid ABC transporter substrate-binding protein, partial [Streptomyces sp. SID6137]|nr:branched-chain amino acid ABC transporter substrate-binding protein [Streptomyces sp. SID6137]